MLHFALPNFYENFYINSFLYELTKIRPEAFKTKISFYIQQGSFPYHSWSGGRNSNVGNGIYYNGLVDLQRASALPYRVNIANVLLEDYDYYDNFSHTMLEVFNCGSTVLEISNIPLMDKLKERYPYYRFTFSKQADLINEFTPELLNDIVESDEFALIGVPDKHTFNLEWLSQLNHKNKFEITVNPLCPVACPNKDVCLLKEHQNQIDYSGAQLTCSCPKTGDCFKEPNVLSIEQILKDYKGFTYFTFSNHYLKTANEWIDFYISYFIKPEYYLEVNNIYGQWSQQHQQALGNENKGEF